MKLFFSLLLVLMSTQCVANSQLKALISEAAKSTSSRSTEIKLGDSVTLPAEIVVSPRGNGSLIIGNLELMIYDDHDNGMVYNKESVSIILTDLDGDRIKELVISGVLVYTGEEDLDPKTYSHFVRVYRYNTAIKKFLNILAVGDFQPDINAE